ncbi:acyl-CoA dehydrogenase, middle domain-containing protein [Ditylenchus destructor]|uniref:Acyl-CoA dehydrogenase, middle domain-containing protein n=1 Tax=Ditylenchus destructor TaxID=166010 RepID=A0AAD4MHB2_9BILA|nr:acyl-CoA dehydrogenase, middle domain-containing protein [Ditylenchus destructor]
MTTNTQNGFNYLDALDFEGQLPEEELAICNRARKYCQEKLMPRVTESFRNETFDTNIMREMGSMGFLGAPYKGYGCAGMSNLAYGLIARELERVDSGYRTIMSAQTSLLIGPILEFGSEEQKQKYVPGLVTGEKIGSFGLTEPDHGSNPAGMETKAVWDESAKVYRLYGTKRWITNAVQADVFLVLARSDRHQNAIKAFILERGSSGLTTHQIKGKISLRTSISGEVTMDGVEVPEANVLPKCQGLQNVLSCLGNARLGIAFGAMGAAEACFEVARNYAVNRVQFKKPIAANQIVQVKLADMCTEISLGLQACYRVAKLKDEGRCTMEQISLIKRNCCGKALEIARMARDILGANGILDENHVMRHLVNLESVNTYEGTHDIHALVLGRAITGLPAFT